ncbi:MAG TPA: amino acid ABC transporter substrate-binding protein [Methylomirabilota bacterium]|nr:amino acid ABC transporter substrate-binding protein [Methylomirabilota bacterium]
MKRIGAAIVALVVLAALVPAHAQGPIKIGASLSLTGSYAKPGKYSHEGYLLCLKDLNARGGLLGRKVELSVYDDRSDPQTGVRLYEKLISEDRVEAVIGPYSSAITEAVANVTEKYRKVMIATLASTTSIFRKGRRYVFMIPSPAETYLEGLLDMAARRGLKRVAFVNEDTLFPKTSVTGGAELARRLGLQVVLQESYGKGATDFTGLLAKVKAAAPDVLAAATYFDDAVAIVRQMKELDVNPKMFGITVGGDLPEFYDLLKANAEYVYGASQWEPTLSYPGQAAFLEAYTKEFGHEPSYHAASAYAGCQLYADAVKRAGTLDSDRVRDVLLALDTTTVFGRFKVDADGFQTGHKMVTSQWQDGKKVIVWPEEVASGKPRFPTPPWSQR